MTAQRTMRDIWTAANRDLRLILAPDVWELNVRDLQPVAWHNGVITLAAPTEQARAWCAGRLNRVIQRELRIFAARPDLTVLYIVQEPVHAQ